METTFNLFEFGERTSGWGPFASRLYARRRRSTPGNFKFLASETITITITLPHPVARWCWTRILLLIESKNSLCVVCVSWSSRKKWPCNLKSNRTILFKHDGRAFIVRTYRDVNIIPNIDIQDALLPLIEPLSAVDRMTLPDGTNKTLTLSAEIQRAVWVSGSSAYIDLRISNRMDQRVRRLQLKLVRLFGSISSTILRLSGSAGIGI